MTLECTRWPAEPANDRAHMPGAVYMEREGLPLTLDDDEPYVLDFGGAVDVEHLPLGVRALIWVGLGIVAGAMAAETYRIWTWLR
jgi:hypothetical protein